MKTPVGHGAMTLENAKLDDLKILPNEPATLEDQPEIIKNGVDHGYIAQGNPTLNDPQTLSIDPASLEDQPDIMKNNVGQGAIAGEKSEVDDPKSEPTTIKDQHEMVKCHSEQGKIDPANKKGQLEVVKSPMKHDDQVSLQYNLDLDLNGTQELDQDANNCDDSQGVIKFVYDDVQHQIVQGDVEDKNKSFKLKPNVTDENKSKEAELTDNVTGNVPNPSSPNLLNDDEGQHEVVNNVENETTKKLDEASKDGQHETAKVFHNSGAKNFTATNNDSSQSANSYNNGDFVQSVMNGKKQTKIDDFVQRSINPNVANDPHHGSKPLLADVFYTGPKNMEQIEFVVKHSVQYLRSERSRFLEDHLLNLLEFMEKEKLQTQSYRYEFSDDTWRKLEQKALSLKEYEMDFSLLKKYKAKHKPFQLPEDQTGCFLLQKYFHRNSKNLYAARSSGNGSCGYNSVSIAMSSCQGFAIEMRFSATLSQIIHRKAIVQEGQIKGWSIFTDGIEDSIMEGAKCQYFDKSFMRMGLKHWTGGSSHLHTISGLARGLGIRIKVKHPPINGIDAQDYMSMNYVLPFNWGKESYLGEDLTIMWSNFSRGGRGSEMLGGDHFIPVMQREKPTVIEVSDTVNEKLNSLVAGGESVKELMRNWSKKKSQMASPISDNVESNSGINDNEKSILEKERDEKSVHQSASVPANCNATMINSANVNYVDPYQSDKKALEDAPFHSEHQVKIGL